ncbi:MAG: DUF1415 family protein [Saprospiraceae bacterium]|jgi:hypothetical protein|nr:DUF1415 domain-containing protein [Chitinophagia bacterium]
MNSEEHYISATKKWIAEFVIGFHLCPFAKSVFDSGYILFSLELSDDAHMQLIAFWNTLQQLEKNKDFSTSILILPNAPEDFESYLEVFEKAESLLEESGLSNTFQLAGFHPAYLFNEEKISAPTHYTNRSPYPLIHILYVDDVRRTIKSHPDIASVPSMNILKMKDLGIESLSQLLQSYYKIDD